VEEDTVDEIVIRGGNVLDGEVLVSGAKNAALPLLFATLLTPGRSVIRNVPAVADVATAIAVLRHLGARVSPSPDGHEVIVDTRDVGCTEAPYDLVKTMRASFLALGPLLARFGHARVSTPGGCAIGARPVDLHLAGLQRLGATLRITEGYVEAHAERLRGAKIVLDFPSVGATQQLMIAAALAEGTTVIENAAREPECVCLALALERMGAGVRGAGTPEVTIEGRPELAGAEHTVIPDRIEAGTFMVAAAVTRGAVRLTGARADHLDAFVQKLRAAGVVIHEREDGVQVERNGPLVAVDAKTMPYPGFPTDLQAQFMTLMTRAEGTSTVTETIFENRFLHAQELVRMGADIRVDGNHAQVRGPQPLSGAPVMATDLRASVCLVLAGLAAGGTTRIARVYHLDRGYERLEEKLSRLGADVARERAAA
jgi:UDP-N-acetylglucosamine 1-carboxyvinyltransferase